MSTKRSGDKDEFATKRQKANQNYYQPLQTLMENENMDDDTGDAEPEQENNTRNKIPPITVVKSTTETLHGIMNVLKIKDYSIRKISIGHKIFCYDTTDLEKTLDEFKKRKLEYFSYTSKSNKPVKAILSGLDVMDVNKVKGELIDLGLHCIDVKLVHRVTEYNREIILYIVYFKYRSITVKELRENYNNINHIRVKWEYQTKKTNKITQCYNCQMFGHGSQNCNVKSFCSICAGPHLTANCFSTIVKCVNCGGTHKSTYNECPNRVKYAELRERYSRNGHKNAPAKQRVVQSSNRNEMFSSTMPNISYADRLRHGPNNNNISNANLNNNNAEGFVNNTLFSFDELKSLTFELIQNLKLCKSKLEQFNVITSLAFKFLS